MKKMFFALALLFAAIGIVAAMPAHAQEKAPMTDEHAARIRNSCQSVLAILGQIRTNDAPVYVNRNQTYFSISDKLIARLNSRLALNRFDTTELVRIANEYNQALTNFRTSYKKYNDSMAELVRMNCGRQPAEFYDKTQQVKELRQEVNETVKKLRALIDEYRQAVVTFKSDHETQLKRSGND